MSEQMELNGWLVPKDLPEVEPKEIEISRIMDAEIGPVPTKAFIASVEKFGVVQPIAVRKSKRGNRGVYEIIDGRRRIRAAKICGRKKIAACVYEQGFDFGDTMLIALNNLRSSNPVAELQAIEGLLKKGASESEITRATGLPIGTIRKRLKLQNLDVTLLDALRDGKIAVSVAERMATLPQPSQEILVGKFSENEKVTANDVLQVRSVQMEEEISTIPMEVFEVEAEPWQKQVIARLDETIKIIPPGEQQVTGWLEDLARQIEAEYGE